MKKCLNPIIAYLGKDALTGKVKLSHFMNFKKFTEIYGDVKAMQVERDENTILLPCRKCVNCQLNRSQEWAVRNTLEAGEYDEGYKLFITLTYNDDSVDNIKKSIISKSGDVIQVLSLKKTDLQKFIKDLRNNFRNNKIRFYACGEYGGITYRPHYHILLYGLSLDDIRYYKDVKGNTYSFELKYKTSNGEFFRSELLEKIWNKGFVDISLFSEYTAGYVARYCTKKQSEVKKMSSYIFYNGLQKQFNNMSLKPAIAARYAIKNLDKIYKDDEFLYHFNEKTIPLKPFKHWDKLYDIERPDEFEFIRANRKDFAKLSDYFDRLDTNLSIAEYLRNCEDIEYKKLSERRKI